MEETMRTLALALLFAIGGSAAAMAQHDPSYYTDRATQERAEREANGDYHDYWDQSPPRGRTYEERGTYEPRRDAERRREQEAYDRGRREADRNQQGNQNDIVNSIGRMFNNNR
jgi:hypothetical protein